MALLDILKKVKKKASDIVGGAENAIGSAASSVGSAINKIEKGSQQAGARARQRVNKAAPVIRDFVKEIPKGLASGALTTSAILADTGVKALQKGEDIVTAPLGKGYKDRLQNLRKRQSETEDRILGNIKPLEEKKGEGFKNYLKGAYNQAVPTLKDVKRATPLQRGAAITDAAITIGTGGLGGVAKGVLGQVGKQGVKQIIKEYGKRALLDGLGGAAGMATQKDATAGDIAKGALGGAIFGTAIKGAGDIGKVGIKQVPKITTKVSQDITKSLQEPKFQPGFASTKGKVKLEPKQPKVETPKIQATTKVDQVKYGGRLQGGQTQKAEIKGDKIVLTSKNGNRTLTKVEIPINEWDKANQGIGNANSRKRALLEKYPTVLGISDDSLSTDLPDFKLDPFYRRLKDGQALVIDDVYRQWKALQPKVETPTIKLTQPAVEKVPVVKIETTKDKKPLTQIAKEFAQQVENKKSAPIASNKIADILPKVEASTIKLTQPKVEVPTTPIIKLKSEKPIVSKKADELAKEALETSMPEPTKPKIAPVARVSTKEDISIPEVPIKPTESRLGNIADDFYQSKKGGSEPSQVELASIGREINEKTKKEFEAIGSNFEDVVRKVQKESRDEIRLTKDSSLTPEEANVWLKFNAELNSVRKNSPKKIGEGNLGELFFPQRKEGFLTEENLVSSFNTNKPGSEFKRENKIALEDLDYSEAPVVEYVVSYGNPKAYETEKIARTLQKENPNVEVQAIQKATSQFLELKDKINSIKTKINLGGFGTRVQVTPKGEFVNSTKILSEMGDTLGLEKTIITGQPKGLIIGDRIDSVDVKGQKLGDVIGLNQHRDAQTFGSTQFTNSAGDRKVLSNSIRNRLENDYNLSPDTVNYLMRRIDTLAPDLPDEAVVSAAISTYKVAAKQQIVSQLQRLEIKNSELQRNVSELTNQILREGSIESELSNKISQAVLKTQDAIFRRASVSSAMNELSDIPSIASIYGKDFITSVVPDFKLLKEFGLGDIDRTIEPYIKQVVKKEGLKKVLSTISDATKFYKFVETYKAALVATASRKSNMARGLSGDDLTKQVLKEYREIALPVDAFTKTALDNLPQYTQYLTWGVRNLQKEKRLAIGEISAGNLQDMSQVERAMRNAYINLPAKTVFWLSSNALKNTAILTAFGLTDFTGFSTDDFSGIQEEDKTAYNKIAKNLNISTTFSGLNSIIEGIQKERLKEQYKDKDYNPYENVNFFEDLKNKYTPAPIRNVMGTLDTLKKGYSENKAGRVQFEAPQGFYDTAKGFVFGKQNTEQARENAGTTSIFGRKGNVFSNLKDMALEQLNLQDTDYKRPLTKEYSESYKGADINNRPELFKGGKQFNEYLDNLKKNDKPAYDTYISTLEGNHVSPEYWKAISSGSDYNIFKTLRDRYKQKYKDLGVKYDPIYNLSDEQAKSVLQQKSTATGEDLALTNILYKEGWYRDYVKQTKEYYADKKPVNAEERKQTDRVKQWYELDDKYQSLKNIQTDDGKAPEWAKQYPLVYQSKAINEKYGFDSPQSKNFYKNNGDNYRAQKALYDNENLELINQMRAIEGVPPLGAEAYSQATNIKDTSGKGGKGGKGGVKVKVPKVKGDLELLKLKSQPKIRIQNLKRTVPSAPAKGIKLSKIKLKNIQANKIKVKGLRRR